MTNSYADTLVLVPTFEEAEAIEMVVKDVQEYVPGCKVLVIDSSSADGTAEIARRSGADVVNAPRRKGKAVRTVLPQVLFQYPDCQYAVMIDGDYTYPAQYIPILVGELRKGVDVVVGYREQRAPGSMSRMNRVGNLALSLLASLLYNVWVWDVCSGMWGFEASVLGRFVIDSDAFTLEADLFRNTVRRGRSLVQIPIAYRTRLGGSDSKLKVSDGLAIAWFLIRKRWK